MKTTLPTLCAALAALAAFAKTSTPEGWLDDYDAALKKAAAEGKHIVVDFSGSDWCGWCKRLDKEVFATDAFRKAAAEKYVLLMVDTPRDKSLLSPKAAKENPKLVKKFGIEGFPTVVVLDPKGKEVARLGYEKGGPEKYIEKLDAEIRDAPDVKEYIKPIEDVLNRYDSQMKEESDAMMKELKKKAEKFMFEELYPKYVALYEKSFAVAKAMKVPERMEARKKELIDGQERNFEMMKKAIRDYEERKKKGTQDSND